MAYTVEEISMLREMSYADGMARGVYDALSLIEGHLPAKARKALEAIVDEKSAKYTEIFQDLHRKQIARMEAAAKRKAARNK